MKRDAGLVSLTILILIAVQAQAALFQGVEADEFNGTTYILAKSEAEVIVPANGSSFNLTLPIRAEMRLFNSSGGEVPVETEVQFWRGYYNYQVVSEEAVEGHLNYTIPITDQRFVALAEEGSSVRVVLPPGYATGDRLLGKAMPRPDGVIVLENRTVLLWTELEGRTLVDVGFYREDAPRAFRLFLLLLAFLAGIVALEHYVSMKRLRSVKREADEDLDGEGGA
jgi:hypothetical protein